MSVPPPTEVAPAIAAPAAIGAGVALFLVSWRPAWKILAQHVVVVAHEGGHALVGSLVGRRAESIHLRRDGNAVTTFASADARLSRVISLFAGYVSPPLLGVGGAALVAAGLSLGAIVAAGVLLLATLRLLTGWFSWVVVLACLGLLGWVGLGGGPDVQAAAAATVVWLLLLGGMRDAHELPASAGDPQLLWRTVWIPGFLWVVAFWIVAAAAVLAGASLLLGVDLGPLAEAAQRLQR